MRFKNATAWMVVAGLILSPTARAEEANASNAQQEYDRRFLSFDDFRAVDLHTGTFYRLTEPYQGKYKEPVAPEAFYLVGREDLAQQYQSREQTRTLLRIAGAATFLAGTVAAVVVAFGPRPSCSASSPNFAQCAAAVQDDAESRAIPSLALFGIGAILGGSLYGGGLQMDPEPVDVTARRELADHYNQELRRRLGLSVMANGDGGGVAMSTRF
jgi:hypothetical protein